MINIKVVLLILIIHWVADFLCQTDYMALNKSKSNKALLWHTLTYTTVWVPLSVIYLGQLAGWFLLITLVAHTITDYITSRATSKLYKEQKRYWFFFVIGIDQVLHYAQLLLTYQLLVR